MVHKHGQYTGEFGAWLTGLIQKRVPLQGYLIFFDHGENVDFANVGAIKGFYGERVTNQNRLADIDVLIANNKDEAVLLIEIEERAISPKKLLGDIYAILFCNRVAIKIGDKQKKISISPKTRLIVAGIVPSSGQRHFKIRDVILPSSGQRHFKIRDVILPRMRQFAVPADAISLENISVISGESSLDLLNKLKEETKHLLHL